jgi:hypothetical protein
MRRLAAFLLVVASAAAPSVAPAKEGARPLLGLVWKAQKPQLVRLDPATLAPLGGGLPVNGAVPNWAASPDGGRLALASLAPLRIRIFDIGEMRQLAVMKLTGAGSVVKLAWLRPDRLLVLHTRPDGARVVWIDPGARRVLKREVLDVGPGAVAAGGGNLVALLPPAEGEGTARLVVASADGGLRIVPLPAIPISLWAPDDGGSFEQISPGLALDSDSRRAYVVGTNGVVAEVDLDSFAVTTHALGRRFAKAMNGDGLQARWLGNGTLAVAGQRYASSAAANGGERVSETPLGLRLIDVRTWSERMLDRGATAMAIVPGSLLAYGTTSSWGGEGAASLAGMGVVAYGMDGSARFRALAGRPVGWVQTTPDRAYAWLGEVNGRLRVAVVDLANGSVQSELDLRPTSLLAES